MSDREDMLVGAFPSVPQQERAQQKRNALLVSGNDLFISKGYAHTTAKEIAANAGVATGTFYRYFSDKRQLLMALLEHQLEKLMPPEPNWVQADPESFMTSLLDAYDRQLNEVGLHRVLPELLPKDPELAEVLEDARRKLHIRIVKGLQKAYSLELTWKDLNFDHVAWAMMLLAENAPKKVGKDRKQADFREVAKVICRMIFPPEVIKNWQTNKKKDSKD